MNTIILRNILAIIKYWFLLTYTTQINWKFTIHSSKSFRSNGHFYKNMYHNPLDELTF